MKKLLINLITFVFFASYALAEDPFSRSFSSPIVSSANDASAGFEGQSDVDSSVHVMMRYDISKYYVKGVVISNEGSIAIMAVPGSKNEILFVGDPIGNDMHTIKQINTDFIVAGKKNGEDVSISVTNPLQVDILN
jgi:Tfp pilus assembly protein PilP